MKTLKKERTRKRQSRSQRQHTTWRFIEIHGNTPYKLGFSHGSQLYKEIKKVFYRLNFLLKYDLKKSHAECIQIIKDFIRPTVETKFPDIFEELCGICDGASSRGIKIPLNDFILWNGYETLRSYFDQNLKHTSNAIQGGGINKGGERCCAFIATGNATKSGKIVIAHNSHVEYSLGQLFNIMLRVNSQIPNTVPFTMQTAAGLVYSSTDWFITDSGIVGCETTLSDIQTPMNIDAAPIFCRAKYSMQFSNTIDEFIKYMTTENAGDYCCAWLLGDTKTGEIAQLELGVSTYSINRTKDGAYVGTNLTYDNNLRIRDSIDEGYVEGFQTSAQNRRARLEYLVYEKYYGELDQINARKILSDHFDSAEGKQIKNSHSICKHVELDDGKNHPDVVTPFAPRGAFDGKVYDTSQSSAWIRWGAPCGQIFSAKKFIKEHSEFSIYKNFLDDFRGEPWIRSCA